MDHAPHTLHTVFLHAASGPQMTACTGESLLCLLLAFEARSGADPSAPHTLSCLLLSSCSSSSQDSKKSLWAAVLESTVLLPLSRPLAAPTTTDLLSGPAVGLPAVLGTRFMLLPLFTLFLILKTICLSLHTHLILYYIPHNHLHHFHLLISIVPSTVIKSLSNTPPSLPLPP